MNQLTTKTLFSQENVRKRFEEMLGSRATSFITSVLQICSQNALLAQADPMSIYNAAAVAATLDLPLNQNLGFAYIVPYKQKYQDEKGQWQSKQVAQFQIGYKGFIQLAQRSGQYKNISATPIFEGQLIEQNPLTGFKFDFTILTSNKVVGFAAYFKLHNGFEKVFYMDAEQMKAHGVKYSQSFKKGGGLWDEDFNGMGIKTVLKLLLSKYGPLSVDMQKAITTDQGILRDDTGSDIVYIDNQPEPVNKEAERIAFMIQDSTTVEELENIRAFVSEDQMELFDQKAEELLSK